MKQLAASIAVLACGLSAGSAYAAEVRDAHVEDYYVDRIILEPYRVRECRTVQQNNAAGGALLGMIIGGIGGKAVTGKDDGAAAGAIVGGIIGANEGAKNSRTRQECNDVERYNQKTIHEYDYSTIHFTYGGHEYELVFFDLNRSK